MEGKYAFSRWSAYLYKVGAWEFGYLLYALFRVPEGVLKSLKQIRSIFFGVVEKARMGGVGEGYCREGKRWVGYW